MSVIAEEALATTIRPAAGAGTEELPRDRAGLLRALDIIDREGWDSAPAVELLEYLRRFVVGPNVATTGLRGPAADQAEATAWSATWEALTQPELRSARSPWGVLWSTARRSAMGELVSGTFLTDVDSGWRLVRRRAICETANYRRTLSLTELAARGVEVVVDTNPSGSAVGSLMRVVLEAMVDAGWDVVTATQLVEAIAVGARRNGRDSWELQGWRPLAKALDLPPWRVRRVMVAMLGTPGWPGLIERLAVEGLDAIEPGDIRAAIRPTVARWTHRPPAAPRRSKRAGRTESTEAA
jgi:hypothetical protein